MKKAAHMHPGNEAHMERTLGEVLSRDEACTVPFLEGVYQMGSGVSRRIHLQLLTRHLLSQSLLGGSADETMIRLKGK
jgi:hypothetical protein